MKIRLEYEKIGSLIFISTLDIERLWERVLRRSGLKLKFTEGYNPKVIKDFSPAIPVGVYSESELIDFIIEENFDINSILSKINNVTPEDLFIKRIKEIEENSISLSSLITHIEIEIVGENIKNINFKELKIEKIINGKLKITELNKLIFKENTSEKGKILVLDSKVSLKDIMNKLNKMDFEFMIIKKDNLTLKNNEIISIFDLD
ncbi:MAG: TIGR03936 family radical SAM-associated protein [Caldisericia bacterium]